MPGRTPPRPRPEHNASLLGVVRDAPSARQLYLQDVRAEVAALAARLTPTWASPASPGLPHFEPTKEPSLRADAVELLRRSPRLAFAGSARGWHRYFTWGLLTVYGAPMLAALRLTTDASAWFWVGPSGWLVLSVPAVILLWHAVHANFDGPRAAPVLLSALMPAALLAGVADLHASGASQLGPRLASVDCVGHAAKLDMQRSWEVAASLYKHCVDRTAQAQGLGPEDQDGLRALRLQDCSEYEVARAPGAEAWAEHHVAWAYLREMEESAECSGWCYRAPPLWTLGEAKDPCSAAAGAALETKVKPLAYQIVGYCGALALAILTAVGALIGHE